MTRLLEQLVLDRIGPADATVGMISLPLPRELAGSVAIDHPHGAMHGVGWWTRHQLPRRSLAFVIDRAGVPATLRLTTRKAAASPRDNGSGGAAPTPYKWNVSTRLTREKLDYKPPRFSDLASLRGVPVEDCTLAIFDLLLAYGGRTLVFQFGATGPDGQSGPYWWQNVQVDRLWHNEAVEAVRVGGIVHNGDTYLWADLYLLLFANGVGHAALHCVNTKLHVEGYDFQGLPVIRFAGQGIKPIDAALPTDLPGGIVDLGVAKLNLTDALKLCGAEHPGSMRSADEGVHWTPFSRTFNPQLPAAPPLEWPAGFARTVRFDFSLSDAPPKIARYRAPSWWYAASSEPWPGGYLPVRGRFAGLSGIGSDEVRGMMTAGRFDAGSAQLANDGYAGVGLMRNYYMTGRPELLEAALDYCYYWADIAVDHRDFTVHQWIGGWPWKTCAYSKFRDVLAGYLETGDPYLLDTVENIAEQYWMWFRTNWPRCTVGRDAFEVGGWAMLRRFTQSERSRERTREFARMLGAVLETRGVIGGQMGAGPHPGYISSLYMTGVTMLSLTEVAEAEMEEGHADAVAPLLRSIEKLHERWTRDDIEFFPSSFGHPVKRNPQENSIWMTLSAHIYPQVARLPGASEEFVLAGLRKGAGMELPEAKDWFSRNRPGDVLLHPRYYDALLLGARVNADASGVEIVPIGEPDLWPAEQVVETPWGDLKVSASARDESAELRFESAKEFSVTVRFGGAVARTTSNGAATVRTAKQLV